LRSGPRNQNFNKQAEPKAPYGSQPAHDRQVGRLGSGSWLDQHLLKTLPDKIEMRLNVPFSVSPARIVVSATCISIYCSTGRPTRGHGIADDITPEAAIELGRCRRVRVDSDIDTEVLGRILDCVLGKGNRYDNSMVRRSSIH